MMRVAVLAALLLSFPSAGQTLEYAGHVSISTAACTGLKSWHYQCLPRVWVPFESVQPTDVVAVCMGQGATDSETVCANTGVNRRWVQRSALTADSVVLVCTVMSGSSCATAKYLRASAIEVQEPEPDPIPDPDPDPIPDPEPEPQPIGLSFRNVTTEVMPGHLVVNTHFWAGLPDINRDGCPDLFVGTHSDTSVINSSGSALSVQLKDAVTGCTGQFEYFTPQELGYTQPAAVPRISSRYMFGNWYGHPEGLWSFYGMDIDGAPNSARYVIDPNVRAGWLPYYLPKSVGCNGSKMFCLPVSWSTDGSLQHVTRMRSYVTPAIGVLRNINTGALIQNPTVNPGYANAHVVLDIDGDAYPEVLVPALGGYFKYAGGVIAWHADKFIGALPDPLAADNHMVPLDYDSDGDMDLWAGYGTYSAVGADSVQHAFHGPKTVFYPLLYRNNGDGTFTDVTDSALGGQTLKNRDYHTTYANTVSADLNLDGYPDLIFGGESLGHNAAGSTVTLLINNGDGTFTVNRDTNFGPFTHSTYSGNRPWINYGDYDQDGRMDIVKTHGRTAEGYDSVAIWRNTSNVGDNKWLAISVSGAGVNTDGLGANITIKNPATGAIIASGQVGAFSTGYQNLTPSFGAWYLSEVDIDIVLPNSLGSCHFRDVATNARYHVSNSCVLGAK